MKPSVLTTALFLDVGGVLGTNGWDESMRRRAAKTFDLDFAQLERRHQRLLDDFETGKLGLDRYLDRVVFDRKRPFSRETFTAFILAQSRPDHEMIDLVRRLKARYRLKIVVVSNENRELMLYRIRRFGLKSLVDVFICSCFVGCRKPDEKIYRMALDVAQVPPEEVVYIEDRAPFVAFARRLGLRGIRQINCQTTRKTLARLGLPLR